MRYTSVTCIPIPLCCVHEYTCTCTKLRTAISSSIELTLPQKLDTKNPALAGQLQQRKKTLHSPCDRSIPSLGPKKQKRFGVSDDVSVLNSLSIRSLTILKQVSADAEQISDNNGVLTHCIAVLIHQLVAHHKLPRILSIL